MKKNTSNKILREFGLLIGFIFPILVGWLLPAIGGDSFKVWPLLVSLPLLIIAIIKPLLLSFPYKVWMKIGNILGWLNSHLILGFIFIVILIPISIAMKIIGYDPLDLKNIGKNHIGKLK